MMVTALTYLYTTEAEIKRKFDSAAADVQMNHNTTTELTTRWEEIVSEATEFINQYLWDLYAAADLSNSHWVRRRATTYGCYLIMKDRGNQGIYGDDVDTITAELQRVRDGLMSVPNLAFSHNIAPAMSNLLMDDRYLSDKIRVVNKISVENESPFQSAAYMYPYEWLF